MVVRSCGASYSFLAAVAGPDQAGQQPATVLRRWPNAAEIGLAGSSPLPAFFFLLRIALEGSRAASAPPSLERLASVPPGKRQENVMWQRNHPQDQPPKARALQAVQVALDRRDNGGDVHAGDDE
jgi:hypothetical protein